MKRRIERTLFWFVDGNEKLLWLNEKYFPLSILFNRMLNENYLGKKILYINIYFRTENTYNLYPKAPKYFTHFYDGHLNYDDVFELSSFSMMTELEQDKFIWKRVSQIIKEASVFIKNEELFTVVENVYNEGIKIDLNPDYRMVEKDIVLYGQNLKAAVWVNFKKDGMYSKLTLEKENEIVFEKGIDKAKNGVEFFLEMYKDISLEGNFITVKGRNDVPYLPLKIQVLEEEIRDKNRSLS